LEAALQTLSEVYLNEDEDEKDNRVVELIQELGKLKQLRKLVLRGLKSTYMSAISSSINEMQQLEKLRICTGDILWIWNNTPIDMHLNSLPPMLQILSLRGKLEKLPEWISNLQNLVKLKLRDSILRYDDIMKLLESLPNLLSLTLHSCHYENEFERLHFQVGSFKNLKELYLYDLFSLNYILFDEGALPSLKHLSVMLQLKTLPTGIQHLKKLEVLNFYNIYGIEITAEEYNQDIGGSELDIIHYSNFEKKEKRYVFVSRRLLLGHCFQTLKC
jgi:disease resistance protein RPM1